MESRYIACDEPGFLRKLSSEKLKPKVKGVWYRGQLDEALFAKSVAIIGSRKMSRYGVQVIAEIVPKFVEAGYTTVSGFMYGIDTEVHRITIDCGGKTVAVLGYGIDHEIDIENMYLYNKIIESGGLVISEYPGTTRGQTWTFPQRNRIVVALCDMVVVVEAGERSGSLNSASWALRQGKSIFAVPGSIFSSTSVGSNTLISEGKAISLTLPRLYQALEKDEDYFYSQKARINRHNSRLTDAESTLVALLRLSGPKRLNELSRLYGKPVGEVAAILMSLLLQGEVSEERGVWGVST